MRPTRYQLRYHRSCLRCNSHRIHVGSTPSSWNMNADLGHPMSRSCPNCPGARHRDRKARRSMLSGVEPTQTKHPTSPPNKAGVQPCRDPGSNRGPSDLRSDALPAELSRHLHFDHTATFKACALLDQHHSKCVESQECNQSAEVSSRKSTNTCVWHEKGVENSSGLRPEPRSFFLNLT